MINTSTPAAICGASSGTNPPFACTLEQATHGPSFHIAHDTDDHEVYRWAVRTISDPDGAANYISRRVAAEVVGQLAHGGDLYARMMANGWPHRTDSQHVAEHVQAPAITRATAREILDELWAGIFTGRHDSTLYDRLIRLGWPIRDQLS